MSDHHYTSNDDLLYLLFYNYSSMHIAIFRSFEIAALIFSPFVGIMLERLGRKNSIMIGFVIVVLATVALGLT